MSIDAPKGMVFSFFDYTGNAVREWAEAGYYCVCFDLQHEGLRIEYVGKGAIAYQQADLNPGARGWALAQAVEETNRDLGLPLKMVFGWPPCEDLTSSGARHFEAKRAVDPLFQVKAVERARAVMIFAELRGVPYLIENPVGRLCTLWRKPDVIWNPYEFGGYLPKNDQHPRHPEYIAARDAYTKKTGAWFGCGFVFPERFAVEPEVLERVTKSGRTIRGSRQFMKLGGKSMRTKNIRNETPRGFARAVFITNAKEA